jgi:hypothetical protein
MDSLEILLQAGEDGGMVDYRTLRALRSSLKALGLLAG